MVFSVILQIVWLFYWCTATTQLLVTATRIVFGIQEPKSQRSKDLFLFYRPKESYPLCGQVEGAACHGLLSFGYLYFALFRVELLECWVADFEIPLKLASLIVLNIPNTGFFGKTSSSVYAILVSAVLFDFFISSRIFSGFYWIVFIAALIIIGVTSEVMLDLRRWRQIQAIVMVVAMISFIHLLFHLNHIVNVVNSLCMFFYRTGLFFIGVYHALIVTFWIASR